MMRRYILIGGESALPIVRLATSLLCAVFSISIAMSSAFACTPALFAAGDGSQASPYEIDTCDRLKNLSSCSGVTYDNTFFVITADFDCGGSGSPYSGVSSFYGSLDGQGHVVSNMYLNASGNTGLFRQLTNAEVKNLVLSGWNVDRRVNSFENTGALAGEAYFSLVENVELRASAVSGHRFAGGLIGIASETTLDTLKVTSSTTVRGSNNYIGGVVGVGHNLTVSGSWLLQNYSVAEYETGGAGFFFVGGVFGYLEGDTKFLDLSAVSVSNLALRATRYGGGFAGRIEGPIKNVSVSNSTITGFTVTNGPGTEIGGVVGVSLYDAHIEATAASLTVTGVSTVGGIVGQASGNVVASLTASNVSGTSFYVGGLVGELTRGKVFGKVSTTTISGASSVGGMVGRTALLLDPAHEILEVSGLSDGDGVISTSVSGQSFIGGVIGFSGNAGSGFADIYRVSVKDSTITSTSGSAVGGAVGLGTNETNFDDVWVKNTSVTGLGRVGGIVGESLVSGHRSMTNLLSEDVRLIQSASNNSQSGGIAGIVDYLSGEDLSVVGLSTEAPNLVGGTTGNTIVRCGGLFGEILGGGVVLRRMVGQGSIRCQQIVGGLAGIISGNVQLSQSATDVSINPSLTISSKVIRLGGILGVTASGVSTSMQVTDSYARNSISGYSLCGGAVGQTFDRAIFSGLTSSGSVSCQQYLGGTIGWAANTAFNNITSLTTLVGSSNSTVDSVSTRLGGIAGYFTQASTNYRFEDVLSTGSVTGFSGKGGVIGQMTGSRSHFKDLRWNRTSTLSDNCFGDGVNPLSCAPTEWQQLTITQPTQGQLFTNASATIAGTGVAGDTVQIYLNGVLAGTALVGSNGTWSAPGLVQTHGAQVVIARAPGRVPSNVMSFRTSLSGGEFFQLDNGQTLPQLRSLICGSGPPLARVQLTVGSFSETTNLSALGRFCIRTIGLTAGTYDVVANFSRGGVAINTATRTGVVFSDGSTQAEQPHQDPVITEIEHRYDSMLVHGMGERMASLALTVNGTPISDGLVGEDGHWMAEIDMPANGAEVMVKAQDAKALNHGFIQDVRPFCEVLSEGQQVELVAKASEAIRSLVRLIPATSDDCGKRQKRAAKAARQELKNLKGRLRSWVVGERLQCNVTPRNCVYASNLNDGELATAMEAIKAVLLESNSLFSCKKKLPKQLVARRGEVRDVIDEFAAAASEPALDCY